MYRDTFIDMQGHLAFKLFAPLLHLMGPYEMKFFGECVNVYEGHTEAGIELRWCLGVVIGFFVGGATDFWVLLGGRLPD